MHFPRTLAFFGFAALAASLGLVTACGDDDSSASPATDGGADAAADTGAQEDAAGDADAGRPQPVPLSLGEGHRPGLAVDATGTAYIAWYGTETGTTTLQFCRLPRGAKACDVRSAITAPGTSISRPFVTVDGDDVRVVSYRYALTGDRFDAIYVFRSTDRAKTFDAGRMIGTVPFNDAIVGPGDALSFATDAVTEGEIYERAAADATEPPATRALLSVDHPYSGAVALIDPATPIVVFADGSGNAQLRRYGGTGELNDVASWSAAKDIGHGEYMHLAAGTSGVFLKARTAANALEVRKWDGDTFGAGVAVPEGTGELPQSHLSQDPAGALHLVWPRIANDGIRLYYASSKDGATWETKLLLTGPDKIESMRVAAASDHAGLTVFEGPNATIRALAVPDPE